jgi:hypothetical protein
MTTWQEFKLRSGAAFVQDRFRTLFGRGARNRRAEDLLQWACSEAESDQFGPPIFLEAFRRLHKAFKAARLHRDGHFMVEMVLGALLVNRLLLEKTYHEQPEILAEPVTRPIFIVGMPRTGSTLLHRLLAHSEDLRTLKFWEASQPCPPPGQRPDTVEPRRVLAQNWCDFIHTRTPKLKAAHYTEADSPEECLYLLRNTFMTRSFLLMGRIEPFLDWLKEQPKNLCYKDYRRQLQVLQWNRGPLRWLLKYPTHSVHALTILQEFPDACFIQTHRHPAQVISSAASLRKCVSSPYWSWEVDAGWRERQYKNLAKSNEELEKAGRILSPERMVHVKFRDFVADPLETARGLAVHFGLEWSDATHARAQKWLSDNPSDRHGKHRHSLEDTGATADQIEERFRDYIERYGLG